MRKAIMISILFHVGLLAWGLGYFANSTKIKPVAKANIPVDIMTPSQLTKIKAGKKTAPKKKTSTPVIKKKVVKKKIVAKKPKPKAKKIAKAKPKPKAVKKAAKPKPKPKPKKRAKTKPKPVKKKVAALKPKKAQRKTKPVKKQPPKSQFDPENIAALLNKLPDKKSAPRATPLQPAPRKQRRARVEPPSYGREYGTDLTMSANEIDAFKAQISQCWRPPTGGLGSRDLNVKLRIRFKPDGTLEKPPELANFSGSPFFRPAAEAAKRAVWSCQPYRMPKDKFATWQDMILNFDPRDMFGG